MGNKKEYIYSNRVNIFRINLVLILYGLYSSIFQKIEGPIIKIKCTAETWRYNIFFEKINKGETAKDIS